MVASCWAILWSRGTLFKDATTLKPSSSWPLTSSQRGLSGKKAAPAQSPNAKTIWLYELSLITILSFTLAIYLQCNWESPRGILMFIFKEWKTEVKLEDMG